MQYKVHIGIDYSGAGTPSARQRGIRVFVAEKALCREIKAPGGHWSRHLLFEWLHSQLTQSDPLFIGIDHGLSLPKAHIDAHGLGSDWRTLIANLSRQWQTDLPGSTVRAIRQHLSENQSPWLGSARLRRRSEICVGAKSVFHFDVPGAVANSTFAGLPWIQRLLEAHPDRLHCWPFDGLSPPAHKHVLAEAYPALWSGRYRQRSNHSQDQHDAYSLARGLQDADASGELKALLHPRLTAEEAEAISLEGWILGA